MAGQESAKTNPALVSIRVPTCEYHVNYRMQKTDTVFLGPNSPNCGLRLQQRTRLNLATVYSLAYLSYGQAEECADWISSELATVNNGERVTISLNR